MISAVLIGQCILMSFLGSIDGLGNGSFDQDMLEVVKTTADEEARVALYLFGNERNLTALRHHSFSSGASATATILLATFGALWLSWAQLCWTSGYLVVTVFGIATWLVLSALNDKIKQQRADQSFTEVSKTLCYSANGQIKQLKLCAERTAVQQSVGAG